MYKAYNPNNQELINKLEREGRINKTIAAWIGTYEENKISAYLDLMTEYEEKRQIWIKIDEAKKTIKQRASVKMEEFE